MTTPTLADALTQLRGHLPPRADDDNHTQAAVRVVVAELGRIQGTHPTFRDCPGCGESVSRCGITNLAYAYDTCSCDKADYEHLVERPWHLACLNTAGPGLAAMEMLRNAEYTLRRYKRGQETARRIGEFLADRSEPGIYPVTWADEDGQQRNEWGRNHFTGEIEPDPDDGDPLYTTTPPPGDTE